MADAFAALTVVLPVGPDDALAPRLREQLQALPRSAQFCVVHADEVAPALPDADPRWFALHSVRGRALQQNAGAHWSTRDWLWFVHADSELDAAVAPALQRCIARAEPALGYFDLRYLRDGPAFMPLNALGARLRSRWFGLPFGDQGLLLPRALFLRLGGFDPALACGEDHDLVWRARRAGVPLRALGASLYTSARKYAERGWWRTTAWHLRETWRQARRFSRADA